MEEAKYKLDQKVLVAFKGKIREVQIQQITRSKENTLYYFRDMMASFYEEDVYLSKEELLKCLKGE